jgi:Replication factor A protein 3
MALPFPDPKREMIAKTVDSTFESSSASTEVSGGEGGSGTLNACHIRLIQDSSACNSKRTASMEMKTPRVNSAHLGEYVGERVRAVAKVIKVGAFHAFFCTIRNLSALFSSISRFNHNRHGMN